MDRWLCWGAVVSTAILPLLYVPLGLVRIVRGCRPARGYWRRRLILNLAENNLGMALNVGLAAAAALAVDADSGAAAGLLPVALAVNVLYTGLIVGFTPRDWWHALPTGIAAAEYAVVLFL